MSGTTACAAASTRSRSLVSAATLAVSSTTSASPRLTLRVSTTRTSTRSRTSGPPASGPVRGRELRRQSEADDPRNPSRRPGQSSRRRHRATVPTSPVARWSWHNDARTQPGPWSYRRPRLAQPHVERDRADPELVRQPRRKVACAVGDHFLSRPRFPPGARLPLSRKSARRRGWRTSPGRPQAARRRDPSRPCGYAPTGAPFRGPTEGAEMKIGLGSLRIIVATVAAVLLAPATTATALPAGQRAEEASVPWSK